MEMNVSTQEEQVVAKKVGGLNPAVVLPILYVIALGIYIFILGNPGNFKNEGVTGLSVAFSDVEIRTYIQILSWELFTWGGQSFTS